MSSRPEGTALVSGYWKIKDNKKSTGLALQINGDQSIRLPGLMTVVVVPVVEGEIEKIDRKSVV